MKKYFNYKFSCILLVSILLISCGKDFLNLSPESSLNGATFFNNEDGIMQSVNASYSTLQSLGRGSLWILGEMRSDNTTFQLNSSNRGNIQREFLDEFLETSNDDQTVLDFWALNYRGISRCNDVLDNVSNTNIQMTDQVRSQYAGEAKFLRAYYYFNLVRQFGGVPLRVTSTKSPSDAISKGRVTSDEIYLQIISDLQYADSTLLSNYSSVNTGRATKGAALTLLAKVYLTGHKYNDALTVLRKITNLGYNLMPKYSDNFNPIFKNNKESIFEIQYLGSQATQSSYFMYQFAPHSSGSIVTGDAGTPIINDPGAGWNIPTKDMIQAYEPGDSRKAVSLSEGYTNGQGNFIAVPYITKYNYGFVTSRNTNVNFPILRYADVILMLAECLNEEGFVANGEAFNMLNQIRNRANLPSKTAGNIDPSLNVSNQASFRDAIYQERRVEFAFENQRWYDLVRTGKALDVMNAHGIREKELHDYLPTNAYQVTQNKLLLPIPQREVTLDNLTQNP